MFKKSDENVMEQNLDLVSVSIINVWAEYDYKLWLKLILFKIPPFLWIFW